VDKSVKRYISEVNPIEFLRSKAEFAAERGDLANAVQYQAAADMLEDSFAEGATWLDLIEWLAEDEAPYYVRAAENKFGRSQG